MRIKTAYLHARAHKDKKWKYFLEDTSEWIELDANLPKSWFVGNASNLEMIWVDSGSFMMGSPASEYNRDAENTPIPLATMSNTSKKRLFVANLCINSKKMP